MNRYGKLTVMELQRFWKLYAALFLVTLVSQMGGLLVILRNYMNTVNRDTFPKHNYSAYVDQFGKLTFYEAVSRAQFWFVGPIVLCMAAMLFYVFFIWYRDWVGKNTFAYRLLMLPTARMNLFWSKLTAIMMFSFGLVAFQLLMLPVYQSLFRLMIPAQLRASDAIVSFVRHHSIFHVLVPPTFADFILYYGAGLLVVTVVFTAILLERCYRLIGLVGGIVYFAAAGLILMGPILLNGTPLIDRLYPMEIFGLELALGAIVLGLSLGFSMYLINRKITV